MSNTSFFTYNVNGLSSKSKLKNVFHWLRSEKVDICLLQEVHFKETCKDEWENDWDGTIICSGNLNNQKGVAILFRNDLKIQILEK